MATSWRTVRVLISSTFRDMHAERDHLVKVVFPALRGRLEPYRVHLIDIDLRWGVTKEQTDNDQVLDVCLQQINECRPFFIGILGERYGWVPTRIPPEVLSRYGWVQHETSKSITELEMLYGALLMDPMRSRRAFFYFRDQAALHDVPAEIRRAVYTETDPDPIHKLADLKERIRLSGYPLMDGYPARWDPQAYDRPTRSHGRLVGLEAFGERVRDQLWQAIQAELALPDTPPAATAADPLAEEADDHERFMESRLRVYVGRERIHRDLFAFTDGDASVACLVVGRSGSGKSAALARFVTEYRREHPATFVLPHFVGAGPRSTGLRDLLRRLCRAFKDRFGFADEVPEGVAELAVIFSEFLGKIPGDARVLLVIDALDQLDETDRAQQMYWLPARLPPHVKVVASCVADPGGTDPLLDALGHRPFSAVGVAPLSDEERLTIIDRVPSLSAKTLDAAQRRLLLDNPATANPLFLLVALEELRGFGSFEGLDERIRSFPGGRRPGMLERSLQFLGVRPAPVQKRDPITTLFTQVIDRLEEEFDRKVVRRILMLLTVARRGLSERELQDLVADLEGSDDLFPILRQLQPYLLSRGGLIDFYHRDLARAVAERHVDSPRKRRAAHARLADYFHEQDDWLESLEAQRARARRAPPTPRPSNTRRVDELPWQRLRAGHRDEFAQLLTNLSFLEAKAEAGLVFDLVADFAAARELLPATHPLRRNLQLLGEAIRRDINFLSLRPTSLFQCLRNTCWWYDHPEAAKHYHPPAAGWPPHGPPWKRPRPLLCERLEAWEAEKAAATPGFRWLCSLRPPPIPLGTAQHAVLHGHEGEVRGVASSPDGRLIASGSADRTIRVWDLASGAQLACLGGHEGEVNCVAFFPDGRRLASGSDDKTIRVWDAVGGVQLRCLRGQGERVACIAVAPDGWSLISGGGGMLWRWDSASGRQLNWYYDMDRWPGTVLSLAISPDGRRIVSGHENAVRIWDFDSRAQLACLRGHSQWIYGVAFSSDGRRIVSGGEDKTIRVWDADTGEESLRIRGHEDVVSSVAFSPDGKRIVSGGGTFDRTIRLWDATSGDQVACISGHEHRVHGVAFSPDGQYVLSGGGDGTVRVWLPEGDDTRMRLYGHEGWTRGIAFSPDGQLIATWGDDDTMRFWDATSGTQLARLQGIDAKIQGEFFMTGRYPSLDSAGDPCPGDETGHPTGREFDRWIEAMVTGFYQSPCQRWKTLEWDPTLGNYHEIDGSPLDDRIRRWLSRDESDVDTRQLGQWRAVGGEIETAFVSAESGEAVTWLPTAFDLSSMAWGNVILSQANGRLWAGIEGYQLYLFVLEGGNEGERGRSEPPECKPGQDRGF